ncbi:uncharacterized protein LY89DRAFT_776190 [Mollisia scopiformis]|uniref:Uncharacterized protein n=1 Tax=Mollisia scopiformis TaxID=149040 RepID=A0A194XUJ5_MOLSC|nr:uncharacterized protein LY89DRAFT_776190 [Mollisia scopiformis]KUJ23990.1 hypothetical protein LY89DRAFT_776190 [Mollisia scopiformis]
MASPPPASADTILFRPSKKRKVYRQRAADDEETTASPPTIATPLSPAAASHPQSLDELISSAASHVAKDGSEEVEGVPVSMAEILRLRKMKKRAGGVEFRAETQSHAPRGDEQALVEHIESAGELGGLIDNGVPRKFAPQMGAVGDVNRHMMAYIDSELAKRRAIEGAQSQTSSTSQIGAGIVSAGQKSTSKESTDVQRQPATLGKLQEVDLGDDVRSKNVELTNRARRILDGENVTDEIPQHGRGKPGKVRLGPDGKPWRGRKRRASEDVARDRLVEDVLRENRLEIYEEPVVEEPTTGNDEAADDRIAEAFRREFMDAVSQRQRKKAGPPQPPARTAAGKKEEEVMKGPKLGGSRTARAAMREAMLKGKK